MCYPFLFGIPADPIGFDSVGWDEETARVMNDVLREETFPMPRRRVPIEDFLDKNKISPARHRRLRDAAEARRPYDDEGRRCCFITYR